MNLSKEIFQACFGPYAGTFAGGQAANNKFDADGVRDSRRLRGPISRAVSVLGAKYRPDMVLAIPNGANWLGIEVAWRLGTALVLLSIDPNTKEIVYHPGGRQQVETAERLLLVEDVPNRRTTTRKVLALPGVAERAVAEIAILDRGIPDEKVHVPVPVEAIFTLPIPAILPPDSPLWGFAS